MNRRMILPRVSRDETTFAVIDYAGVERANLKQAVQLAVTAWVEHSESGRQAFDNASEDFNVGDLANELGDPALRAELKKQGVTNLAIDVYCDDMPTGWEFDDLLVLDDRSGSGAASAN
jgi:hypothetical protein